MNLFKFLSLVIVVTELTTCDFKEKNKELIIEGSIKNFPYKKLYFAEAHEWDRPIYTETVKDGNFQFKISVPLNYTPTLMASLGYRDSSGKIKLIEFTNHILSPDSIKYVYSAFILDSIHISISGDFLKTPYMNILAGEETASLYATQMMNFGILNSDILRRADDFKKHALLIKRYPNSNYLISQLFENRAGIKKKEIQSLASNFNITVFQNGLGKKLKDYIDRKEEIPTLVQMQLEDERGLIRNVIDSTSKLNMIILWASWCSPCRKEIPSIKLIQNRYKGKGLLITSISIDELKDKWRQALKVENMPWKQLIVPFNIREEFKIKYEYSSIPDVIFTDSNGKIIERFIGYQDDQSKEYEKVIERVLN